jgi:hypothetical protein
MTTHLSLPHPPISPRCDKPWAYSTGPPGTTMVEAADIPIHTFMAMRMV